VEDFREELGQKWDVMEGLNTDLEVPFTSLACQARQSAALGDGGVKQKG
jgi:hypothetical protein